MTTEFFAILDFIQDGSAVLLLCWIRIWVVFKVVPFFGGPSLPSLARNTITVALSLILYPVVVQGMVDVQTTDFFWFVSIVIKEAFIGFLIGHAVGLVFWAVGGIGFFIDNQRGASMASSMNPLLGDQDSPMGIFLTQVLVTLLFVSGGILSLFSGIYKSYVLWPPTTYFPKLDLSSVEYFLGEMDHLMYLIVLLSGPIIICMFIAEFGLALVGRFAPQLNVFFLAMPIKSGIAIAVMIVYLHVLMEFIAEDYRAFEYVPKVLESILR